MKVEAQPSPINSFEHLMRRLISVPKPELKAEERKYQQQKAKADQAKAAKSKKKK